MHYVQPIMFTDRALCVYIMTPNSWNSLTSKHFDLLVYNVASFTIHVSLSANEMGQCALAFNTYTVRDWQRDHYREYEASSCIEFLVTLSFCSQRFNFLAQVRLGTEVLRIPSSTRLRFKTHDLQITTVHFMSLRHCF